MTAINSLDTVPKVLLIILSTIQRLILFVFHEKLRSMWYSRLGKAIGVPALKLRSETQDYKQSALHTYQSVGCTSFEAWKTAVGKRAQHPKTLASHPQGVLKRALRRLGMYTPSSSTNEQLFSKYHWLFKPQWASMLEEGWGICKCNKHTNTMSNFTHE